MTASGSSPGAERRTPYLLANMTREHIRRIAATSTVVVPIGSIEQHGPHLPVGTDTSIIHDLATRAVSSAAEQVPVVLAPTMPFGSAAYHLPYFALSLDSRTVYLVLRDLCESLATAGFEKIFILNGHGGNASTVRQVATDLSTRLNIQIAASDYWSIGDADLRALDVTSVSRWSGHWSGHAGGFETSLNLALNPDLVDRDAFPTSGGFPDDYERPEVYLQDPAVWTASGGYTDTPENASAAAGATFLDALGAAIAREIVTFHRWTIKEHG